MASIRKALYRVLDENPVVKDLIESCRGKSDKEIFKIIEQWRRGQKQGVE